MGVALNFLFLSSAYYVFSKKKKSLSLLLFGFNLGTNWEVETASFLPWISPFFPPVQAKLVSFYVLLFSLSFQFWFILNMGLQFFWFNFQWELKFVGFLEIKKKVSFFSLFSNSCEFFILDECDWNSWLAFYFRYKLG